MLLNQSEDSSEDSMEASPSMIVNSYPKKRKADSDPAVVEDSDGEIEERHDGKAKIEECEAVPDHLKAPEWDVDSFDGLEYYSSPLADTSSDDDEQTLSDDEALEHYRISKRQIIESKGFYADPKLKPSYNYKRIRPVRLELQAFKDKTYGEYWEEMVHVCLQKYNQDKDLNVEFVEVVRGLYRGAPRSKSYITFMAREKPDGPLVEYQAKCMVTFDRKMHPILCRLAPTQIPGKRKAEFEPEEEEEESDDEKEEGSDGKAKIEEPKAKFDILMAPEWDVDSFDGLEYYSSPEVDLSSDDEPVSEEAMEHYRIYKHQMIESKGFYGDPELRPIDPYKLIRPMSLDWMALNDKNFREYWEEMVFVCLQKLNQDKGLNVEFVQVVRGYYRGGPRSKSYITFMAREKPEGPLVEYQAKCMVTLDRKRHPILCRPAPKPKP